jgi:hypothetical protein
LLIEAVKLTLVPEQTFGVAVLMLIVGVTSGFTVIAMAELVTAAGVAQVALDVSVQVTLAPLVSAALV